MIFALPALCRLQMQGDRQRARFELEGLLFTFAARLEHPLIIVYDGNEFVSNPDAQRSHALETSPVCRSLRLARHRPVRVGAAGGRARTERRRELVALLGLSAGLGRCRHL